MVRFNAHFHILYHLGVMVVGVVRVRQTRRNPSPKEGR